MLVEINFKTDAPKSEIINLKDYGFDTETKWDDLTDEERNEITDSLSEKYCVYCGGTELSYENNLSIYNDEFDDEEIKLIEKLKN